MVKVGVIGLGFMGRMHFNALRTYPDVKVTALCDIEPEKRSGGWLTVVGNIKDDRAPATVDLTGIGMYEDGLELIRKADTNVIVVTTPGYLHRQYAVAALEAGKDVISEKPIAITLEDADAVVDAANASGKLMLVAQCVRFWPDYTAAREIIQSRAYGKVKSAFFRRVGGSPAWSWRGWFLDGRLSGGALLDLHVHDVDFIQNVFGIPKEVSAVGTIDTVCHHGGVDHVVASYLYPDGPVVTAQATWFKATSFPFEMSFTINLERASLLYNSHTQTRLTIYLPDGTSQQPELPPGDGYTNETGYFLSCINKRLKPERMMPLEARNDIAIALAEREALLTGRPTAVPVRV